MPIGAIGRTQTMSVAELITALREFNPSAGVEMAPWGDKEHSAIGKLTAVYPEENKAECEIVFLEIDLDLD
jgi:hypothetical protein